VTDAPFYNGLTLNSDAREDLVFTGYGSHRKRVFAIGKELHTLEAQVGTPIAARRLLRGKGRSILRVLRQGHGRHASTRPVEIGRHDRFDRFRRDVEFTQTRQGPARHIVCLQ
jgi:hypothetical protein